MQCAECQTDIKDKVYIVSTDDEWENREIELCKKCYQDWLQTQ